MPNALCYDNLVVQNEIASDRVDLIYFDVLLRFPAGDLISRAGPQHPQLSMALLTV
jgi:hypothetical protein